MSHANHTNTAKPTIESLPILADSYAERDLFTLDGKKYTSVLHYYYTVRNGAIDPNTYSNINENTDFVEYKRTQNKCPGANWHKDRSLALQRARKAKFIQSKKCTAALLATGNLLIESRPRGKSPCQEKNLMELRGLLSRIL